MLEYTNWQWLVKMTFIIALPCVTEVAAFGGDWPQILGPNRNGQADGEIISPDWARQPPTRIWQINAGEGYAGPAVLGDRIVFMHRRGMLESLDCLSADTGEQVWSTQWKASYAGGIDRDRGPRCVPLVHGDHVFALDAGGELRCVRFGDGKILWARSLAKDLKARDGYFGFGSSPILVGDTLMVNAGGQNGNSIVALDVDSGITRWAALEDGASYSAPTWWTDGNGGQNAIFVTRMHFVGVRPRDGKILFRLPFGARGPTVNAATPIMIDQERVFLTSSYRVGAKCISLKEPNDPKTIWESDDVLSSQYPTPVLHGRHLYGIHGREDGPLASLRCVDVDNGQVKWKRDGFGMAHLIVADDKLLSLTTAGELVLISLSSERYKELGRIRVSEATTRALPALSRGRLYARDTNGVLAAWQLPE